MNIHVEDSRVRRMTEYVSEQLFPPDAFAFCKVEAGQKREFPLRESDRPPVERRGMPVFREGEGRGRLVGPKDCRPHTAERDREREVGSSPAGKGENGGGRSLLHKRSVKIDEIHIPRGHSPDVRFPSEVGEQSVKFKTQKIGNIPIAPDNDRTRHIRLSFLNKLESRLLYRKNRALSTIPPGKCAKPGENDGNIPSPLDIKMFVCYNSVVRSFRRYEIYENSK